MTGFCRQLQNHRSDMTAFLVRRIALAFVTLFTVLTLVFVIVRILPGDPAQLILGDQATREAIEALHVRLGLDQPIATQYLTFLLNALRGDWGTSMVTGRSVLAEVLDVLPWTLQLTVVSLAIGVVLGVPLGVWAAVRRNRLADYVIRITSLAGLSFPAFVAAIILLFLFAIELRWFPVISAHKGSLKAWTQSITLPAISLGLNTAAYITRVTRSAMLEVLSEDYVRTARAKGVPQRVVVWRHALGNAAIPIITVAGLYLSTLIGNSVLTEIVFSRPGLGKLIVGALSQRDYTMLEGMMVTYTIAVVVVNLLSDLTYGFADPRVTFG
jgi:glutathione transport system permease protein